MPGHQFINLHCHNRKPISGTITLQSAFPEQAKVMEVIPGTLLSVGLHPWHVHHNNAHDQLKDIEILAQKKHVLAIGEIGLDRNAEATLIRQEEFFRHQAQIAERFEKPLIIHCVRCYSELMFLHKDIKPKVPWIIHGFRGNQQTANKLIQKGFYLSFGASLTENIKKLEKVFINIPLDRIFLETDESNLPIEKIYYSATCLRKISLEELKLIILNNFKTCFRK